MTLGSKQSVIVSAGHIIRYACYLVYIVFDTQLAEGREILMHHCHGSDAMYQFSLTLNLATPEGKERFMKKWALDRHKVIVLPLIPFMIMSKSLSQTFCSAATGSMCNRAH
jgi:hypothetical protein